MFRQVSYDLRNYERNLSNCVRKPDVGSWSFVSSNEPVRNECEVIFEMFHLLNVKSYIELRRTGIARSRVQTPLKSWLFQASIRNCLDCVHNCEDHSLLDFKIYYFFRFDKQINCLFATWYLIIPASFLPAHDFFLRKFLVLEVEWFSLKNFLARLNSLVI